MKKKTLMIILVIVLALAVTGCTKNKYAISGTFYADDEDGRTYIVYSSGKIASDELPEMSYEHLKGEEYILHLDKADVLASYDKAHNLVEFRYDGLNVHWYNDYLTAEKSRVERGFSPIVAGVVEDPEQPTEEELAKAEEEQRLKEEEERKAEEEQKKAEEEQKKAEEEQRLKEEEERKKAEDEQNENERKKLLGTWTSPTSTMTFRDNGVVAVQTGDTSKEYTFKVVVGIVVLTDIDNNHTTYESSFTDDNTLILTYNEVPTEYKRAEGGTNE